MPHRTRHRATLLAVALTLAGATLSFPPAANAIVCASAPAGLIARWPGDGSTAEVAHGRNGTLVDNTTFAAGLVGQAFSFDGSGDTATIPDDPDWTLGTNDFTIDTWVNFTADTGHPMALIASDQGVGVQPKWILWRANGELGFYVNGDTISAAWTPTNGQWYHVAVTRSGTTFTMYIDGASVATSTDTVDITDASGPLTLGSAEGDFWMYGLIDEPEMYQRALSDTEIAAIHTQSSAARCAMTTSSLSMLAAPASAPGGSTISLSGTLALSSGTVTGTPIELTRSVDGAPAQTLTTVLAAADGSFSYDDVPPAGAITYRAIFAGGTDIAAASGWATATVTQQASALTLSASTKRITYGGAVKLTAHLSGGTTNREVTIYAQPKGGAKKILKQGTVDAGGKLAFTTKPTKTTTYSAKYAGELAWKPSASKTIEVGVAARWTGKATGGYATVHGYRLYHYSPTCGNGSPKTCPTALFTLAPNHAGQRVSFEGEFCGGGHCVHDHWTVRLTRKSQASSYIYYGNRSVIGWTLNLRVTFQGDREHKASTSEWIKTRVTA